MGSDKNVKRYIGKYEIVEEIGKGGMGVVYKGIDPYIERTLAIKTIRFDIPKDETDHKKWKKRFLREAKLAGNLAHPNIVTIYDAGEESGLFYIAMEYIEGKSLREFLRTSKKIGFGEVQSLMEQICDALSYASKKGVIHCDIKPENIIIDKEGKVYLVDFGIARTSTADLTKTMLSMVTPSYTSPERLNGMEPDVRSDIFALGAVLYEIVSGQKAFQGDTVSTIMKSILYDAPIKVEAISSDIPKEIHYIIHRALAKDPNNRYQNYEELLSDLKDYKHLKPDESFDADYNPDGMTVLLPRKGKFRLIKPMAISVLAAVVSAGLILFIYSRYTSTKSDGDAGRGELFIEQKNYDEAITHLYKALASDPTDVNARYLLGLAYHKKGLFDDSIVHYKEAIDINKSFPPPYKGLADAYEEKGEIDQAIFYNEQYLQLVPQADDAALIQKKLSELKSSSPSDAAEGESAETIKTAETVNEIKGDTRQKDPTENAYDKGKELFDSKEYAKAIVYFQEVLKTDPENEDVKRYLRLATHEEKKREDIALNRSLGITSYENKNYLQATLYFNEILALDPENQDAKRYLALIQQQSMDEKIEEITKPDAIKERPFYKRTVKILALDSDQAVKFEHIYSATGTKLEQQLKGSTDTKERSEALKTFTRQTYSELRKILKPDQIVKLDNLIAAKKESKAQFEGSAEKPSNDAAGATVPDKTADTEKDAITTEGQAIPKGVPSDTGGSETKAAGASGDDSGEKGSAVESIALGIQAYNEKRYDQATSYFNDVLKSDPNNAEAKKYLEYIKLAKIKMMNENAAGEAGPENIEKGDEDLPEGL